MTHLNSVIALNFPFLRPFEIRHLVQKKLVRKIKEPTLVMPTLKTTAIPMDKLTSTSGPLNASGR